MHAIYGSHGQPQSPGLDITRITRKTAGNRVSERQRLEVYARQQIRQHEELFGFRPHGYELRLIDFHRRAAGKRRLAQDDSSAVEVALPAVSSIHLEQVVRQLPLHGAEIELQVDDENRLVSFFSSFVPDAPVNPRQHQVSSDEALEVALDAFAPGANPTDEQATVEPVFALDRGQVVPAYRVFLSLENTDAFVLVHGITSAILESSDESEELEFEGHTSIPGRLFPEHPTFEIRTSSPESMAGARTLSSSGASAPSFLSGLENVELKHIRERNPLELNGHFAAVFNLEQPSWNAEVGPLISPRDEWIMRVDPLPLDGTVFEECPQDGAPAIHSVPLFFNEENRTFESRFDEMSAYYHVTNVAEHYLVRHDYEMHRSTNAQPQVNVYVNAEYRDRAAGTFKHGCYKSCFIGFCDSGCRPTVYFNGSRCWRLLEMGNDSHFVPDPVEITPMMVDYYSWTDVSRDRDVAWHEYSHAIAWDIAAIKTESAGEDFDEAGGAFKEGAADFFAVSTRTGRSSYSPWLRQRELDPFRSAGTIEDDFAWPYDRDLPDDEKHENGRIWSTFLWDLRKRAILIGAELTSSGIGADSVEDLQFEAYFRMPKRVEGWETPLSRLLDADEALTGSQLSYEIVASAARHGLKLTRGLAVIEPAHYVIERGDEVRFTIYTGANIGCSMSLSRNPAFPQDETSRTFACADVCIRERIPAANDDENLRFRCTLDLATILDLTDKDASTAIFYRVNSSGIAGAHRSFISGGGNTLLHEDVPAIFIVPPGTTGGCLPSCTISSGRPGPASVLVLCLAVLFVRQRRRVAELP